MGAVKVLAVAAATAMLSTAAVAADLSAPVLPVVETAVEASGWYLRGDVGVGSQSIKGFDHHQTNPEFQWPASWRLVQTEMGDAAFVGFGVGYTWNNWFRTDVTGEYRMNAKFKAIGGYREFCAGGEECFDVYDGSHQSWVVMANAYIDLGTWWCITPFVGAGVGAARNTVSGLHDVGYNSDGGTGFGYAASDYSKWNLAWAVHAGLTYNVSNSLKIEFAYRYLNLGDVQTGVIGCAADGCESSGPRASYTLNHLSSHDLKIGLRWMFQQETPVYTQPVLVRKG